MEQDSTDKNTQKTLGSPEYQVFQGNQASNFEILQDRDPKTGDQIYLIKIPTQNMLKVAEKIEMFRNSHQMFSHIKVYESFSNRGKYQSVKYDYNKSERFLTIKLKKRYYQEGFKMREFDLLKIINGFSNQWKQSFAKTIQIFIRCFNDNKRDLQKNPEGKGKPYQFIDLIAIDLISLTFEITYVNNPNKKKIRFRISYFQFKNQVKQFFFKDSFYQKADISNEIAKIGIMENAQTISYCDSGSVNSDDYYSVPRLNFLQDQKINDTYLKRLLYKFNIFHSIFNLCRGVSNESLQFNKKALNKFMFQGTRMKNFKLTFVFENPVSQHWKIRRNMEQKKAQQLDQHRVFFQFIFYVDDNGFKADQAYDISMAVQDQDRFFSNRDPIKDGRIKKQFFQKIEDLYQPQKKSDNMYGSTTTQHSSSSTNNQYLKKIVKDDKIILPNHQTHGNGYFSDRFCKFIANFCVQVSFLFDRVYFSRDIKPQIITEKELLIHLMTYLKQQYSEPGSKYRFDHFFLLTFKSSYQKRNQKNVLIPEQNTFERLLRVTQKIVIKDERKMEEQRNSKRYGGTSNGFNYEHSVSEYLAQETFQQNPSRIPNYQIYMKANHGYVHKALQYFENKDRKEKGTLFEQTVNLDEVFVKYINNLLRMYPLRDIYQDIFEFITSLIKTIYDKPRTDLKPNKFDRREKIMKKVVSVIMKIYNNAGSVDPRDTRQVKTVSKIKIFPEDDSNDSRNDQIGKYLIPMNEDQGSVFAEVTYNYEQAKLGWIERIPFGNTIIRLFDNKIQVEKGSPFSRQSIPISDSPDLLREEELVKAFHVFQLSSTSIQ